MAQLWRDFQKYGTIEFNILQKLGIRKVSRINTLQPRAWAIFNPLSKGTKMAITSTNIVVVSTDTSYNIPGDWTAEQITATYSAQIPGLANMTAETTIVGDVKTVTFKPRTGTKGAVASTNIVVVSTDTSYNIPGDWTAEQIAATYSAQIPGLANMTAETTITEDVKTVTFKPRTGTKG